MGVQGVQPNIVATLDQVSILLQAAIADMGIAIIHRCLARDAVESGWPNTRCIVGVRGLIAPARVDFISGVEIVIDFDIELLADIGLAEAEPIRTTTGLLHPTIIGRIQAIAKLVVVRPRHRAQHLFYVSGRIHLGAIGIPGRSLNYGV